MFFFFRESRAACSSFVGLLQGTCDFILRISTVTEATNAARLGLLANEGNLSDFF